MEHIETIDDSEFEGPSYQQLKKRMLVAMIVSAFLYGLFSGVLIVLGHDPEDSFLFGLGTIILSIILFILWLMWIGYDAKQHFFKLSFPWRVFIFLMAAIAVPIYLFRVRGLAAFKTIGIMILFLCLLIVVLYIGMILVGIVAILLGLEI